MSVGYWQGRVSSMTDKTVPGDYGKDDGWSDEQACEICPHCEQAYSPNGGYIEEVYDKRGIKYETFIDTDPAKGPFFCPDCWDELETNQRASENKSLGDFL